jgi:hypothetical protein
MGGNNSTIFGDDIDEITPRVARRKFKMQIRRKRVNRGKQRGELGEFRRRGESQSNHRDISGRGRSAGWHRDERIDGGTGRKEKHTRKKKRERNRGDSPRGGTKVAGIEERLLGVARPRGEKGGAENRNWGHCQIIIYDVDRGGDNSGRGTWGRG